MAYLCIGSCFRCANHQSMFGICNNVKPVESEFDWSTGHPAISHLPQGVPIQNINHRTPSEYRQISAVAGIVAFLGGFIVILGWMLDAQTIKSVLPGLATMKANTALCILLLGASLLIFTVWGNESRGRIPFRLSKASAAVSTVVSGLTLLQYVFRLDFHIDQMLFHDPATGADNFPGRMAFATVVTLSLIGVALVLLGSKLRGADWLAQGFGAAACIVSVTALFGYATDVAALYETPGFGSMALNTAALCLILATGIVICRPRRGAMRTITAGYGGGQLARIALPIAILAPLIIGWIISRLVAGHGYPANMGLAVATIANVLVISFTIWLSASLINRADFRREAVERHNAHLASIVHSSDDAIFSKALNGTIMSWNRAAVNLYGYTPEEAVGQHISLLAPPNMEGEMLDFIERIRKGENVYHHETVRQRKDKSLLNVSLSISPVYDSEGNVIAAATIARDITEKKRTEDALNRERSLLRAVFDTAVDAILTINDQGIILSTNPASIKIFGYTHDELVGKNVKLLMPRPYTEEHDGYISSFLATGEKKIIGIGREVIGLRKDGSEFPIDLAVGEAQTTEGRIFTGIIRDISERKKSEALVAAHVAEVERSNAELEQFAYIASHDLQEPLRMVVSYMGLLNDRYMGKLDERADKYIGYAVEGASRMQQLVNDLLTYSRINSNAKPFVPISTQNVVENVITGLTRVINEARAIVSVGELPEVLGDEGQLGQLFQNLISNAIKFMPESRDPHIEISVEPSNGKWLFSVKDNGIGIEESHAARIFQMFQRLHERGRYEGSGIGLALAKKIVERHGGSIWFSSVPDEGTTFYFSIPRVQGEAA
jgi:PAS domain S-box-containing protein